MLRWWGVRIGVALFAGAVSAALLGSIGAGAAAFGLVMWVVASVAWDDRRNRGNAAHGIRRSGRRGASADGAFYAAPGAGDGGCGGGFDGGGGFGGGDGGGGGGGC